MFGKKFNSLFFTLLVTNVCSYVFWFGDLNFRLSGEASPVELSEAAMKGDLDELWKLDELSQVQESGQAFSELHEERPRFLPTYKHEFGKTQFSKRWVHFCTSSEK